LTLNGTPQMDGEINPLGLVGLCVGYWVKKNYVWSAFKKRLMDNSFSLCHLFDTSESGIDPFELMCLF
jgi:hypothetical protein